MITSFFGEYRFLSNFYAVSIEFEGLDYPSAEHAYVASKTLDDDMRKQIAKIETPGKVKRFGIELNLRSDWSDDLKLIIMRKILEKKFRSDRIDPPLWEWLRATAPEELVEGNSWGDKFWGQCPVGVGKNHLGKLLTSIRDDVTMNFT